MDFENYQNLDDLDNIIEDFTLNRERKSLGSESGSAETEGADDDDISAQVRSISCPP
jgi:hypothetical protein